MPKGIAANGKRKQRCDKGKPRKVNINALLSGVVMHPAPAAPEVHETDEQISARIEQRFEIMELMAEATAFGHNKSFIVSGPPGLGKSYGIKKVTDNAQKKGYSAQHIQGFVRPTGLYKTLYENRGKQCFIIFDDADSVFLDDTSLNILKIACDTTRSRTISWLAEHKMEDQGGELIPRSFEFEGSIIFITNYDFDSLISRGHRLAPHFEALISRSHYLDLSLKTKRDYLVRIKQVVGQGMLRELRLGEEGEQEIVDYITENSERLRELSLRMVLKIGNLVKLKKNWKEIARITCMR